MPGCAAFAPIPQAQDAAMAMQSCPRISGRTTLQGARVPATMPPSPLRREVINYLQGGNGAQSRRVPAGGLIEVVASGRISC